MKKIIFITFILSFVISCSKKNNNILNDNNSKNEPTLVAEVEDKDQIPKFVTVNCNDGKNLWIIDYEVYFNMYHTNGYVIIRKIEIIDKSKNNIDCSYTNYIGTIHNVLLSFMDIPSWKFRVAESIISTSIKFNNAKIVLWDDVAKTGKNHVGRKYGIPFSTKYSRN